MNISPCLIGLTLLFSSIYMSFMKKDNKMFVHFMEILDQEQKIKYQKIIYERMMIYMIGMILGVSLGLFFLYRNKNEKYKLCKFLVIIYLVKLGFYYVYPKSPLMLYSLSSKEQTDAWADIYSEMKNRWKLSIFLGFISYLIIGFSFCR